MRSFAEIRFRARQEFANLALAAWPRKLAATEPSALKLPPTQPVVDALRDSEFAHFVQRTAEQILSHEVPLLGRTIDTGSEVRWRRDYLHDIQTEATYFRRIPYLDFSRVGDHKVIWELNRHQHLVLLAQAYLFTGNKNYTAEIFRQLDTWFAQNPFQRGINWASALEVAFRALSWVWIFHFIGSEMPDEFRYKFLTGLYRHGLHLAENLSIYFSPNTHLLGEAVALHALGTLFPQFPGARHWRERGLMLVEAQLEFQVAKDGSHFEQSSYYHIYALDFFLFSYLIADRPKHWQPVLLKMAEYLHWLLGRAGRIAFWGDDDGGRLFFPYGDRSQFGRATLATCGILFGRNEWVGTIGNVAEQAAWWLGAGAVGGKVAKRTAPAGSRSFADGGMVFLQAGDLYLQMHCGGFGYGGAGHSHSDSLSVTVQLAGEFVLIDPGTFTYIAEPAERRWFRSSAAHNTVRVDDLDQGTQSGPFRWSTKPEVKLTTWEPAEGHIVATCKYAGFTHTRIVQMDAQSLSIQDAIEGPPGEHTCEQVWQLGPAAEKVAFSFSADPVWQASKRSAAYGTKTAGESLILTVTSKLPITLYMRLGINGVAQFDR